MGLTTALHSAVSGLSAASARAAAVSDNLANASTPAYGARSVVMASNGHGMSGVQQLGLQRSSDPRLTADRREAEANKQQDDRVAAMMEALEAAVGSVDNDSNIAMRLAQFESALISAQSDPASDLRLNAAVEKLDAVAETLNRYSQSIQTLRKEADGQIANDVSFVNEALGNLAKLNKQILRAQPQSSEAASVMDRQGAILDQLTSIIPLKVQTDSRGAVSLMANDGTVLLDSRPRELLFSAASVVTPEMSQESGGLSGITVTGGASDRPLTARAMGLGALAAAFEIRDQRLPSYHRQVDELAFSLGSRLQDVFVDGSISTGLSGLLSDQGAQVRAENIMGLSARIEINSQLKEPLGARHLQDGLYGGQSLGDSDPQQIERWANALQGVTEGESFVASVGKDRVLAQQNKSFSNAQWSSLREAEAAQGIDTDQELQNLMQIERSYAANAKVIQTLDAMFQQILKV